MEAANEAVTDPEAELSQSVSSPGEARTVHADVVHDASLVYS